MLSTEPGNYKYFIQRQLFLKENVSRRAFRVGWNIGLVKISGRNLMKVKVSNS